MGVSVLTMVRNRSAHLAQLVEGLRRSYRQPDELIVVDMSDEPVTVGPTSFPFRIDRFDTDGLPLAAARNRAASLATHDMLVFLDVDCIPLRDCVGLLADTLSERDALLCADILYLGPEDARGTWNEADLLKCGRAHPVRAFPTRGVREEENAGLFWSLAFALRRPTLTALGGFDERFTGYGAEDIRRGFAAEVGITSEAETWRTEDDRAIGVVITAEGRAAIGIEDVGDEDRAAANETVAEPEKEAPATPTPAPARPSKTADVLALLRRAEGATLDELVAATGWLPHTTRAALTGLRKKGHAITRGKRGETSCYNLKAEVAA